MEYEAKQQEALPRETMVAPIAPVSQTEVAQTGKGDFFIPEEDEWFWGKVVHTDQNKYLLIELLTGIQVYCAWQKVKQSPGMHSKCLQPGTECAVRVCLEGGIYWCLEMRIDDTAFFRETSKAQITKWAGVAGTAVRECGCPIFVLWSDRSNINPSAICHGDWVEISLAPSDKKSGVGYIHKFVEVWP
jgi:hypothetical protein